MFKRLVTSLLKRAAQKRLQHSKLLVVGVSGSAGKTSTKAAIALALSAYFPTLSSPKNYNNEFGVPLTILTEKTPAQALGWLSVLGRAWWKRKLPLPYQALVLEMGIDQPGDMEYLLRIVKPDLAVLTNIGTVHLQAFSNQEALAAEKLKLLRGLGQEGVAIINQDDPALAAASASLSSKVISFGKSKKADLRFRVSGQPGNLAFTISGASKEPLTLQTNLLSQHQGYILSASMAVVQALGLDPTPAAQALTKLQAPPGRETLLPGIKNSLIIDSTYNSSPAAAKAMLATLQQVSQAQNRRPVAILGDMLELGSDEAIAHQTIIQELANYPLAILVGQAFKAALDRLYPEQQPNNLHWFSKSEALVPCLQAKLQDHDCILFKASQGIRLEKALQHFLAEPMQATQVLVRQEASWQRH
ncbi:MAG: hypothetical protein A2788_00070 [Candidatus Abawacabacteria bacterium RIFCSPHIGHO2_01_FULL_46_8]|uniref:UDP-N-acetylmuramoyl-tripeptide--D-alanyl-D-alanine ligase n=1 Tax=Candidatus Abawacabacteria bacterium RIFCSPHIGHO2_01_FULL_46_8 TaxID=1817815 RepID=A0A1F4XKL1_9BACT|nr:MAG: hypothetical protein A2788_00070 [Candidatus Abawacabacteria bacterium RIFCSPHIGHO2_01_FULL_46_8]